jgi:MFS family permease
MMSFMIRQALGIVAPVLMTTYHISPQTMGHILAGFNWTNTGVMLFSGVIVDRVGPWLSMGIGSGISGLSTFALPVATTAGSLLLMRMLFGLGQGIMLPSITASVARLFTLKERARAISVVFVGNQVGLTIAPLIAAPILASMGWQAVFYVLGACSLLLTILWIFFYPDKRTSTNVQAQKKDTSKDQRVPWLQMLRYRSTWGIALGQLGYLYGFFFFVAWLPTYLVQERGMTILRSGLYTGLPFLGGIFGTLAGGWLGDFLIKSGVSTTTSRKSIIGVGLSLSTSMMVAAAYVGQVWLAVTLITLCVTALRLTTGSVNSLPIDLAPPGMVGSLSSIQNFFGNVGGLLAPIVTGYIVGATGSFVYALVAAGGMVLFGAVCYVFVVGNLETSRIRSKND